MSDIYVQKVKAKQYDGTLNGFIYLLKTFNWHGDTVKYDDNTNNVIINKL